MSGDEEQGDRLDDLQKRLSSLKEDVSSPSSKVTKNEDSDIGKAYELVATPIVAGGIGVGIDHIFDTSPVFFLTLAVLGVLAGFWMIVKAEKQADKNANKND